MDIKMIDFYKSIIRHLNFFLTCYYKSGKWKPIRNLLANIGIPFKNPSIAACNLFRFEGD